MSSHRFVSFCDPRACLEVPPNDAWPVGGTNWSTLTARNSSFVEWGNWETIPFQLHGDRGRSLLPPTSTGRIPFQARPLEMHQSFFGFWQLRNRFTCDVGLRLHHQGEHCAGTT